MAHFLASPYAFISTPQAKMECSLLLLLLLSSTRIQQNPQYDYHGDPSALRMFQTGVVLALLPSLPCVRRSAPVITATFLMSFNRSRFD
jgi:hypothetical protein